MNKLPSFRQFLPKGGVPYKTYRARFVGTFFYAAVSMLALLCFALIYFFFLKATVPFSPFLTFAGVLLSIVLIFALLPFLIEYTKREKAFLKQFGEGLVCEVSLLETGIRISMHEMSFDLNANSFRVARITKRAVLLDFLFFSFPLNNESSTFEAINHLNALKAIELPPKLPVSKT